VLSVITARANAELTGPDYHDREERMA